MGQKAAGQLDTSRLLVPALLLLGWIVGCAVVVYYVFS
ncbi:sarcoplasmic/endoplasmic reticulum calcium ATPase regulator DWORF-like [Megalops cyprinoides]|nr:sarcoplasmic/endoplasmic reticulum calcium ATPase regulator DWORF-like [Megalops cyprinoides]